MSPVPRYAIVGHPNEGKSSVVATLAEDDEVRISDKPGETLRCREVPLRIGGVDCIHFVDTPGFQNPRKVQAVFEEAVAAGSNPIEAFLKETRGDPAMGHDRELLGPLAAGVGVIYVVDASRPPGAVDRAEIEVLRLSGLPRIAVLNHKRKTGRDWKKEWSEICQRAFNATREFNAHEAPFEARLRFVENLRLVDAAHEAVLESVVERMKADREERMDALVTGLMRWIGEALSHRYTMKLRMGANREDSAERARAGYWRELDRMEKRIWAEFRTLLKHHRVRFELANDELLAEDVGSEKTWQVLGLTRRQLTVAAAVMGAGVGVAVDSALAGLGFGIFTAIGAATGAASVHFFGHELPKIEVAGFRIGADRIVAGPSRSPQFPFVILDRSLLYLQVLLARTHARRDPVTVEGEPGESKLGIVAALSDSDRKQFAKWFKKVRSGTSPGESSEVSSEVRAIVRRVLET